MCKIKEKDADPVYSVPKYRPLHLGEETRNLKRAVLQACFGALSPTQSWLLS